MLIHNADVAIVFNQIADLLEIKGDNPFRIRAYRNAARTLNALAFSVQTMVAEKSDLTELPGIGIDLAGKISEIVTTGTCALREQLHRQLPPSIHELLTVPGLGPKRVKALYQQRNIQTLDQLFNSARNGQIRNIPGFGIRSEQRILEAIRTQQSKKKRYRLDLAESVASALLRYLQALPDVKKIEIAGSFRRRQETVGDLDIVISSSRPSLVIQQFIQFEDVTQILAQGTTRASVVLRQGMQVDLRVVASVSFGAALYYFTGSKAHNIAVRVLAQKRGLKMNEYGVFSGTQRIAAETELAVFQAIGLPYIEPELRENRGEIAAAQAGKLPQLIQLADLTGDLHAHTKASDGRNSLREMAMEAKKRGLSYLAITDHSSSLTIAHGLDAEGLTRQMDEIDQLNAELGIKLLKGCEVEINEDGSLDLPDNILERLEIVVGAVHSKFGLSRERQTKRILRAMDHPCFTLLAHPSGRLILEREPYDVDMHQIILHARQRGCFLELNAQPSRLDLTDTHCMMAKNEGVLISVNSDAHSIFDFDDLRFGIAQARRGWLEKKDVLNTLPIKQLLSAISRP
ncbi:DNA polymerase (family 10) [Collimonas sp. OK242]|uniref:DNA polymerase/3'-5' exonuclease PolX n=1 Tax=Collimonas sp. OK242 TaxID=1798195 RepID=UPI000898C092|nr:DNA polymerase/3'-5' exonuclease PolX [Collimonas sp. OK242]SDY56149.1 DNA polymerase (family 10) [Collimonas sp. OK242]